MESSSCLSIDDIHRVAYSESDGEEERMGGDDLDSFSGEHEEDDDVSRETQAKERRRDKIATRGT